MALRCLCSGNKYFKFSFTVEDSLAMFFFSEPMCIGLYRVQLLLFLACRFRVIQGL